ncbi:MAG: flagellar basal-body rod protein FlgF [Alphaproteobacteria bacterium]|nr:flagellar basal-body rod protein FlgF [Alphaproteobacteria bacterium]
MENGIYLGLSRQLTLRTNMDLIANNLANMNTPGFRGQNLLFVEYIDQPRGGDPLSFSYDKGQYELTAPGSMSFTENPLDVAIAGPGFFGVQAPGGVTAYTRGGDFQRSADGMLVTSAGYPVAGQGGGAITIPQGSLEISIDEAGVVSTQDGQIGQLMVVEFDDLQELEPMGNNLYKAPSPGRPATESHVRQGQLEGSNVTPVVEMTRMIDTLRSFQSLQQILQSENDRLRTAIQKLTQGG